MKLDMIKIGNLEFPRPVREQLHQGREYFVVSLLSREPIQPFNWFGDEDDYLMLRRGLIHLSYEDAQAHYEALMAVNTGENHE